MPNQSPPTRYSAVAQVGKLEFGGFIAWLAWLVLHLYYLVGHKNRITAVLAWLVSFLGRGRGQMAITSQMIFARQALNQADGRIRGPLAAADEAEEAEQRWGHTDAYKESARRTKQYGKAEWEQIRAEGDAVFARFAELMAANAPIDDPRVQAAVTAHREHITRWFYPCSVEIQRGLAEMFVADARFTQNIDKIAPGLAPMHRPP